VLVFVPQYGYIHPDEFFQTSEIVSGEFLVFVLAKFIKGKYFHPLKAKLSN
jgi:hypothetical protein